ncbi:hypothetical protein [Desulfatiferula olefinivorans]
MGAFGHRVKGEIPGETLAQDGQHRVFHHKRQHPFGTGEGHRDPVTAGPGDGKGFIDHLAGGVDAHRGRAGDGDVREAHDGNSAGGDHGIGVAHADQADPGVGQKHAPGQGIHVAGVQPGRALTHEDHQAVTGEDAAAAAFREAHVAFDGDEVGDGKAQVGHGEGEHLPFGFPEDNGDGPAGKGDGLIDGGAGGVDAQNDAAPCGDGTGRHGGIA